jgi:hypothetical protein
MKVKPFCLHKTERANNHIKQANAFFFARNSVGVTYKQLTAMLTDAIHTFSHIASFGILRAGWISFNWATECWNEWCASP